MMKPVCYMNPRICISLRVLTNQRHNLYEAISDPIPYIVFKCPNISTSEYVCKIFELPEFDDKQHIVMVEPLIEAGNEGTVHHIILYVCSEDRVNGTIEDHHQETCDEWDTKFVEHAIHSSPPFCHIDHVVVLIPFALIDPLQYAV